MSRNAIFWSQRTVDFFGNDGSLSEGSICEKRAWRDWEPEQANGAATVRTGRQSDLLERDVWIVEALEDGKRKTASG